MDTTTQLCRPDLGNFSAASNLLYNEKIRQLIKAGQTIYHFGFGQAPFPVIETAVEALKEHAGENAYLPVAGIPELRKAICKFHSRYDGLLNLDPDNVIVGPGSKELIFNLLNIFSGNVLIVSPAWTTYKPQAVLARLQPFLLKTNKANHWRITPEIMENTLKTNKMTGNKLLILTNPDNPTGTCYNEFHLRALSDVFRKHKIIVLSDEIYARLHYEQSHVTIARYYPEGTILSSGLSKWASAGGWRVGYHIYPKELGSLKMAVKCAASNTYSCAPAPMQFAAAKMFENVDACENYMKHTTRVMAAVSRHCYKELCSVGVDVVPSQAGYYLFPDFEILRNNLYKRGIKTCEEMCAALLSEASVGLMAGGPSFLRPVDEFTTRLCYVNFDGTDALAYSRKLGLDTPLPETFVKEYCEPVYEGIQALTQWVQKQLTDY